MNISFLLTPWTWFICGWLKTFKESRVDCSIVDTGTVLRIGEDVSEFLNTIHRNHILLKLKSKRTLEKVVLKISGGVFFAVFYT